MNIEPTHRIDLCCDSVVAGNEVVEFYVEIVNRLAYEVLPGVDQVQLTDVLALVLKHPGNIIQVNRQVNIR